MTAKITQIYVDQRPVGLAGLEEIFAELARLPQESAEFLQEELLRRVAAANYIPPAARPAYRQALWREFRRFRGEELEPEPASRLIIKVLGLGCAGCQIFYQGVLDILARQRIQADLEYITHPERLKEYALPALPALLINGRVVVAGRIPAPAELEAVLKEAQNKIHPGQR